LYNMFETVAQRETQEADSAEQKRQAEQKKAAAKEFLAEHGLREGTDRVRYTVMVAVAKKLSMQWPTDPSLSELKALRDAAQGAGPGYAGMHRLLTHWVFTVDPQYRVVMEQAEEAARESRRDADSAEQKRLLKEQEREPREREQKMEAEQKKAKAQEFLANAFGIQEDIANPWPRWTENITVGDLKIFRDNAQLAGYTTSSSCLKNNTNFKSVYKI
jgi:hypothetical protein